MCSVGASICASTYSRRVNITAIGVEADEHGMPLEPRSRWHVLSWRSFSSPRRVPSGLGGLETRKRVVKSGTWRWREWQMEPNPSEQTESMIVMAVTSRRHAIQCLVQVFVPDILGRKTPRPD